MQQLQRAKWDQPHWQRMLAVHAGSPDLPPMLGAYRVHDGKLRFEPQFPLEPGVVYTAIFRPDQLPGKASRRDNAITATFQLPPQNATPTTTVTHIYPSAETAPENLLKFYIQFSAPMRRGNIYDYIRLEDGAGKAVELPFLEIDEELWDPAMTRLTLFIDPGRIKRGVKPLEEIGPSLEEGKSYRLVIDRAWRDGAGNPLKEEFQKAFRVGPADREPPDHKRWQVSPPQAGTREPLVVRFSEPMDAALAQRMISVRSPSDELFAGTVALDDQERRWTFKPDKPWPRGPHQLVIQTTIEDLAGNNIGKPFEVDIFNGVQRHLTATTVKLPFTIR
ncbi:MAG: Ig-like domain-containing protein [Blastocatellia bacterium]